MKKLLTTLALGGTLLAGSAVCGAEGVAWLSADDVSLGDIQPNMSLDYVRAVYGPMKDTKTHYTDHAYGYGDTVKIVPSADGNFVKSIIVSGNNGWATPAGVTVGMDVSVLKQIYGEGTTNPVRHKSHHMPGFDYYTYWPTSDHTIFLSFAAKDGKISYIKVGSMER